LDPAQAYEVLNSLRKFYLAKHPTDSTSDSFPVAPREVSGYKAALDDAEAGLSQFRQTEGLSDPNVGSTVRLTAAASQSRAIQQAISTDERRIQSEQEKIKALEQESGPGRFVGDDHLLQDLGNRLQAAETKRSQFLLKYAQNYPLVRDADHAVAEARAAIAAAHKGLDQTTDGDRRLELLREKLTHDRADLAREQASGIAIGRGAAKIKAQRLKPSSGGFDEADVEREAKTGERNYLLYLSKREQERTSGALRPQTVNVTIAAPPTPPASPAHRRGVIVLIALAFATFVSVPVAVIVDCRDRGFHSPDEVVDSLGITVVLGVPRRTA
jgi:uncharacterized protein involved in exopolysaccharide biosynthesis